jgi:predicted CXXCH cytochrome family protein
MKLVLEVSTGEETTVREWDGKVLRLGRSPESDVQLFGPGVAEHHVRLLEDGDGLRLECPMNASVRLNDEPVRKAKLETGNSFYIDSHKITIRSSDAQGVVANVRVLQYDDVTKIPTAATSENIAVRSAKSSKRKWSYGLLTLGLLLSLAFPLMSTFDAETKLVFEEYGLPTDTIWSSGDLASAHNIPGIANECKVCHQSPFVSVRDSDCLTCHQELPAHGNNDIHKQVGESQRQCLSCHKEHNEPSTLVHTDNAFCTDCHADTLDWDDNKKTLPPVLGFSAAEHPEFKLQYLTPHSTADTIDWQNIAHSTTAKTPEMSNLKFPHDLHLGGDKVQRSDGQAMECSDCHSLDKNGEHFEPITMDTTCRSCHALEFDIQAKGRELHHGEPELVLQQLTEYFALQYTDPALRAEREQDGRRMPSIASLSAMDRDTCKEDAIDCARQAALLEAETQFERTGCAVCHVILKDESKPLHQRWHVEPIQLQDNWYNTRFDHTVHMVGDQKTETGMCLTCHQADESTHSSDVLIPDLGKCVTCHTDARVAATKKQVSSSCIDCHSFHIPGKPKMLDAYLGRIHD